jgi:hypothetical protein
MNPSIRLALIERGQFMKALAAAIFTMFFAVQCAQAANYPSELQGVWGWQKQKYDGPDRLEDAQRNCELYRAGRVVGGWVLVFEGTKKWSFGSANYADEFTDQNISVKKTGRGRWRISDRHYDDHAGPTHEGAWVTMTYEATIKGDVLALKDKGGSTDRFTRCQPPSPPPRDIRPSWDPV